MWGKRAGQNSQGVQKSEGEGEKRAETKPWLLLALTELHLQEQELDALSRLWGGISVPGMFQCPPECLITWEWMSHE